MQKLLLSSIWSQIKTLSKQAHRTQSAIAYVSSSGYLHLKPGDTLIVNASEPAIKSGATSAKVLSKWHRDGVNLFSSDRLHAKLIVMDEFAFIGSANASILSAEQLNEAVLLTDSPVVVSQARSFIYQFAQEAESPTKDRIKQLCKIKVARQKIPLGTRRKTFVASGDTTWVVSKVDLDERKYANEQRDVEQAQRKLATSYPKADPTWIRWTGKSRFRNQTKNGDRFIVHTRETTRGTPYEVHPPSTLLEKQDQGKWTRFYYDPELSRPKKTLSWKAFRDLLKVAGVHKKLEKNTTASLSFQEAMELECLWPRKR